MAKVARLTTKDNPYDPFDDFKAWYEYDVNVLGYDTCGKIARLCNWPVNGTQVEQSKAEEEAMDRLIRLGVNDKYYKIYREID